MAGLVALMLSRARYPDLLPPLPPVVFRVGPAYPLKQFDYYDPIRRVIFLPSGNVESLFHELGHVYDRTFLTPELRKEIEPILGVSHRRWFWGSWDPRKHGGVGPLEEVFADLYAKAMMHRLPMRAWRLRRKLRQLRAA